MTLRLTAADLHVAKGPPVDPLSIKMEDGTVYVLPDPKTLSIGALKSLIGATSTEQVAVILGEAAFEKLAAHPEVDYPFFDALVRAYTNHYRAQHLPRAAAMFKPSGPPPRITHQPPTTRSLTT